MIFHANCHQKVNTISMKILLPSTEAEVQSLIINEANTGAMED